MTITLPYQVAAQRNASHVSRRAKLQGGALPGLIGAHLRKAETFIFQKFQKIVAQYGITPSEFGLLLLIYENEGINQSDLGKSIGADRSTMVALMDRFEERGLAQRTPAQHDRRAHALRLTPEGQAIMAKLIPAVDQHEQNIAANLTVQEQQQLMDLLSRLTKDTEV